MLCLARRGGFTTLVLGRGSGLDHSPPFSHHLYPHRGPIHFYILIFWLSKQKISPFISCQAPRGAKLEVRPLRSWSLLHQKVYSKTGATNKYQLHMHGTPDLHSAFSLFCDCLSGKILLASTLVFGREQCIKVSRTKGAPFSVALSLALPAIVTKCHGIQICKEFHPNHLTFTTFQYHSIY